MTKEGPVSGTLNYFKQKWTMEYVQYIRNFITYLRYKL